MSFYKITWDRNTGMYRVEKRNDGILDYYYIPVKYFECKLDAMRYIEKISEKELAQFYRGEKINGLENETS